MMKLGDTLMQSCCHLVGSFSSHISHLQSLEQIVDSIDPGIGLVSPHLWSCLHWWQKMT